LEDLENQEDTLQQDDEIYFEVNYLLEIYSILVLLFEKQIHETMKKDSNEEDLYHRNQQYFVQIEHLLLFLLVK